MGCDLKKIHFSLVTLTICSLKRFLFQIIIVLFLLYHKELSSNQLAMRLTLSF